MAMRHIAIALGLVVSWPALPAAAGIIHRRGDLGPIEAPIISMDDAGVVVRTPGGASQTVAWDVVRDIEPDVPDLNLPERLARAAEMWRARARLQRNDAALAEPLFERLFERYRGKTGESALIVAEGLLRCRLARGAHDAAVIPFLEMARMRRAGAATDRYAALTPVYDDTWSLCPQLAPVWAGAAGLDKLQRDLESFDAQGDAVVAAVAALYARAARAQASGPVALADAPPPELPHHEGAAFLASLLDVMSADSARRSAARGRLAGQLPSLPPWAEAWARHVIGLSLLAESGIELKRRGMVSLAHVPARFGASQPYLAALASLRLADALSASGRLEEAAAIRADARRRFPGHPVFLLNEPEPGPSDRIKENA